MNALVVPPSPNWYSTQILACAPDNTLIYGSKNVVVVIFPTPNESSLKIKFLDRAHTQKVVSVDINFQWGLPNQWLVTSGEDNHVKLWDIKKLAKISSHSAHQDQKDKLVGARFLTEDRILSVSESGTMFIWHPSNMECTKLGNFFLSKVTISCFCPCPHATYITAFGLKNGLIVVANLKKNGSLLFKLRGHTNEVVSLSWCPAPINIFPSKPNNYIKGTVTPDKVEKESEVQQFEESKESVNGETGVKEDLKPALDAENAEKIKENTVQLKDDSEKKSCETRKSSTKKQNPWVNLKFVDDDEVQNIEEPVVEETKDYNFLKECDLLKRKIEGLPSDCEITSDQSTTSNIEIPKPEESDEKKTTVVQLNNESKIKDINVEKESEIQQIKESEACINSEINLKPSPDVENVKLKENIEHSETKCETQNSSNSIKSVEFIDNDAIQEEESVEEIDNFLKACDLLNKKIVKLSNGGTNQNSSSDIESITTEQTEEKETNEMELKNESDIKDMRTELIEEMGVNETELKNESGNEELKVSVLIHSEPSIKKDESSPTAEDNLEESCKLEKSEIEESHQKVAVMKTENTEGDSHKTITVKSIEEEPKKEFLLASSGKDSTVYIWRAGTDGRMQCFFRIPEKKVYQSKGKKGKDLSWTVVKWITPFTLLTTTKKGELLKYILPKPRNSQKEFTIVHNEHNSIIFSIASPVPTLTVENWLTPLKPTIWTFGHDMFLLNTVLDSTTTHLASMETFCALISCLEQSPLDPSRICMGVSNGVVKIWNTNDPHVKNFSTANYSPKIYSKITSLAWHPTNELLVAFSTEEGTIGILNTNKLQKATWFKQSFSNTVHKIQWGPFSNSKDGIGLYASGGGDLLCFNPDEPNAEPHKIKLLANTPTYTFSWKLDKSLLLVVESSGKIIMLTTDFSPKAIYYQKKKISSVVWHPDSECSSEEKFCKSYWVAAALDNAVYIFDFAEVSHKEGTLDIQDVTKAVLEGHQGSIRSVAWSPYDGNRLVTAGEDGLAHVWDVETKQILASYYGQHFEPIKSIMWSPNNEDLLICSSANASLIVWKMSDYPAPLDQDILAKCKLQLKNEKRNNLPKEEDLAMKTSKKIKKSTKHAILPSFNATSNDSSTEKVKILQELLDWKENGNYVKTNGVPRIKHLFGTKEDVLKLLTFSELSHLEKGKQEAATMVSFWKGDLHSNIIEAIDHRKVTPLLISLAPTVSLSIWQKACETYALQLEEKTDSDPLEIATYYMACQNIEKSIECLCEREMFKEALALAKCRLPEDNIFVDNILQKWATFSACCGNLETAAQCYIVLGKYEEAVKVLFRRSEFDILSFALELAKKSNNDELVKAVEFRCKAFAAGDMGDLVVPLLDKRDLVDNKDVENGEKQGEMENVELEGKEEQHIEQIIDKLEVNKKAEKVTPIEKHSDVNVLEINGKQEVEPEITDNGTEN